MSACGIVETVTGLPHYPDHTATESCWFREVRLRGIELVFTYLTALSSQYARRQLRFAVYRVSDEIQPGMHQSCPETDQTTGS